MLKKLVLLSGLLLTSMTAHAALISHFGYERDSASDVVKGGGLEWLKWDVTKGMSINSAQSAYASQGYRVASNKEVVALFQQFNFGKTDWTEVWSYQGHSINWSIGEDSAHNAFLSMFGATDSSSCAGATSYGCYSDTDPYLLSQAIYNKSDIHSTNGWARISDDSTYTYHQRPDLSPQTYNAVAERGYGETWSDKSWANPSYGVALVRDYKPQTVAVPTPASIGLLALGLVALGYRRRQVLGR